MIIYAVTPNSRFTKRENGELFLTSRIAIAVYAETPEDEATIKKFLEENVQA